MNFPNFGGNNPFNFGGPNGGSCGGGGGFEGPMQNPFSMNAMAFEVKAVHELTGNTKEGIMTVHLPVTATELHARKMILEMAYQWGWRMRALNRIDKSIPGNDEE